MTNKSEAQTAVERTLAGMTAGSSEELIVVESATIEKPFGWIFFYNSKRYLETRNLSYAIAGNGPIFVARADGEAIVFGSHKAVKEIVAELEQRYGH